MKKVEGAFLTISELADELGLPQHILRYWETRFPQLRPLQRAGNRRYYRPADVALARRIHELLHVQGFTVKGAQKSLGDKSVTTSSEEDRPVPGPDKDILAQLERVRADLAAALGA
ncbi:DNA-binding transcriptional MerR regulator [Sphingobium sp. OAS761]|uniref:MerR family transcriptional regulator n=1 Tax=Sphingobium sp. OAS761 TaxID=2817901 RepID=UPI00209D5287|nr:MerR family transcriptional regulator [Sphingobium sp. OAS761]MCP1468953.1 DNA-binding transcriptional MerR regulator [Sphingobium sp. OAS761]